MVRYKSFSLPPNYRQITAKSLSIVLESLRHLQASMGVQTSLQKVVTHWYSEVLLSDTLPTSLRHLLRHLHRHSAIISSIIYTVFRDKNKKTSNFTAGGLTTKIFYDGISDILKISVIPHKP